jgi:hypothetical protein
MLLVIKGREMPSRGVAWGTGAALMLAAVNSALINELRGGWPWWVAAALATATGAVLAGWLTTRTTSGGGNSLVVGDGGVYAGRDIAGQVRTQHSPSAPSFVQQRPPVVGRGAVVAGRDITKSAHIDTTGGPNDGAVPDQNR